MIRLKQLLFEQTGTTTIKVGGVDVVGTTVNNTQSTRDPWTYFISSDGKYYTTKKATPNAWKDLSTALSPANFAKAKQRVDSWKVATPAAAPTQTVTGVENPEQTGVVNDPATGVVKDPATDVVNPATDDVETDDVETETETASKIDLYKLDSLPSEFATFGDLAGSKLTLDDPTAPAVAPGTIIDLSRLNNNFIMDDGRYLIRINATSQLRRDKSMFRVKKENRWFKKDELKPIDVCDMSAKNYIWMQNSSRDETFCIVKIKDGIYKAFYAD